MENFPLNLQAVETLPCPGYLSPVTGVRYVREGQTHDMVTRNGVRCASCGVTYAEAANRNPIARRMAVIQAGS